MRKYVYPSTSNLSSKLRILSNVTTITPNLVTYRLLIFVSAPNEIDVTGSFSDIKYKMYGDFKFGICIP